MFGRSKKKQAAQQMQVAPEALALLQAMQAGQQMAQQQQMMQQQMMQQQMGQPAMGQQPMPQQPMAQQPAMMPQQPQAASSAGPNGRPTDDGAAWHGTAADAAHMQIACC